MTWDRQIERIFLDKNGTIAFTQCHAIVYKAQSSDETALVAQAAVVENSSSVGARAGCQP